MSRAEYYEDISGFVEVKIQESEEEELEKNNKLIPDVKLERNVYSRSCREKRSRADTFEPK